MLSADRCIARSHAVAVEPNFVELAGKNKLCRYTFHRQLDVSLVEEELLVLLECEYDDGVRGCF